MSAPLGPQLSSTASSLSQLFPRTDKARLPWGIGNRNMENPCVLSSCSAGALLLLLPGQGRSAMLCPCSCRQKSSLLLGQLQKFSQGVGGEKSEECSSIHFPWPMQHRDFLLSLTILFPLLWSVTSRGPRGNISFQTGTWTMRKDALSNSRTENISVFIRTSRNAARPQILVSI